MKKLSLVLAFIINILIITPIYSQVDLKLIIRTPTPSEIYEWQQDPTIIQLIVNNQTTTEYPNATFGFRISNEDGIIIAESKYNSRSAPRFNILPMPQITILNGSQIIDVNSITYNSSAMSTSYSSNVMSALIMPNTIPEGFYEICISVYDQYGKNITSGEEYCTNFTVLIPEPPIIISPMDDDILSNPFPNFIWTPVTNYSTGRTHIKYKLKICPVYKGQSPRTAIDRNPVLIEKTDILTSSYIYLPSDMPFDYFKDIERYVWMVQAFDENGKPATSNQGRSELATFRIEKKVEPTITLSNIYPNDKDTIPWDLPHLFSKFTPYSDDVSSVEFTLTVKKDGTSDEYTNTRTLTFAGGAKASQQLSTDDEASLIISNLDNNRAFPIWMPFLEKGIKYNWTVEAEFTKTDGSTETVISPETSFVIGFKNLIKTSPPKDSMIVKGKKINYTFEITRPEKLNFENNAVLSNESFHGYNSYSTASGKFSIEIAKKSSFDTIVQTQMFVLSNKDEWKTGDECNDLFKATKQLDGVSDTGTYYYRLNYLNNADQKYYTSAPKSIKIVPDSIITCFEMLVQSPTNNGEWPSNKNPQFAVSINPEINKSAITGGRIRVWQKSTHQQSNTDAKKEKPVLDTTFTGTDTSKIFAFTTDMAGYTKYNLNFINGDSTSKTFKVKLDTSYVWNFKLSYNKDSIRKDKLLCNSDSLVSNDGVFKVVKGEDEENSCPGDCEAEAPTNTTAGTQTLAKDSTITIGKFKLKLNNVSGSASHLSGDGTINVPYMRSDIKVEFSGLQVNSDNVVFSGEAYAKIDEDAPYTKQESKDFEGKALNFAEGALKFKEIHDHSSSTGKLISGLTGTEPVTLPLGYDKDVNGFKTVLCIIAMKFTPTRGSLNLATYVTLPSLGTDVGFGLGAKNICFHDNGFGGKEKAILYLAQDFGYNNDSTWSMLFKAPTPTEQGTYLACDCKTFNKLTIAGEVEFPSSWLKTIDGDSTKLVKAYFKTIAEKSGNGWQWMASANLDECEFSGAEGYKMQVQEMVFDYSIDKNPEGIKFPTIYSGEKTKLWKGFYIKRAWVSFPDDIKTFDEESPKLSINNVIIDKAGITASIWGENVIQYPKANFGGWGASIDTIKIDLVSSSLQSGKMDGRFKVSIFDTCLVYNALIAKKTDGKVKYAFNIVPKDTLTTDAIKGKINLFPTSTISINYNDSTSGFYAAASLTGNYSMDGAAGNLKKLNFKGIKFERFTVSTRSPYVEKGKWGLASPQHGMQGFPVSIDSINVVSESRNSAYGLGLQFNVNIGFQSGSNAISGATKLSVWSKLESGSGGQRFVFDGVDLDAVKINADMGSVKLSGSLELYDSHSTFGDGFRGVVNATFVDQVSVMATAQFGNVNNYRYWYVDAKAIFPEAVPVFSGVGMYGFGGGAWYHMQKSGTTNLSESASAPDASNTAGKTNSGYSYIPNQNIDLGLRATLVLGTLSSPKAFNADVGMDAQFLSGGGIGTIGLVGNGYLMCDITNRSQAKILADVNIEYNFPTSTLHGVFDVRLNGVDPLTGEGPMVMHYAPNLWYIKMGEPSNPMEISLASLAGAEGYFMMGQNLPTPQLPSQIKSLFPGQNIVRNSAIEMGDGFAFGASAGFETGRQTCSIFYGEISALVGFDMALLDYGVGTHCADMDGPIGLNGWYASGQVYASVAASIGLHVDLYFTSGNYEILNLNAGAVLQGAGPNPTWVRGTVGGNYRILSGAVKGHCNFEFSHGDQCEIVVENPMSRIDLISDIHPINGTTNVDVMTETQVAMNFELNKSFELQEMSTDNVTPTVRTFRIKLRDFNLRRSSNDNSVAGRINIAPDNFSAYYSSNNMLSGNTNYTCDVSAFGEEYINGVWQPAVKNDGSLIVQTVTTSFTSGDAPNNIPQQNIAYTYPVNTQKYFLQDECRAGRIQLKTGQANLFATRFGGQYDTELIARFISSDDNIQAIEVPFTYNSASKLLFFDIPNLLNEEAYDIQIIRREILKQSSDDSKSGDNEDDEFMDDRKAQFITAKESLMHKSGSSNMYLNQRKISATRVGSNEKLLYAMNFKTSKFNNLQGKLSTFNYISTESIFSSNIYEVHKAAYEGDESFGYFDFNPITWTSSGATHTFGPLVKTNGFERSSTWHNSFANPQIYDNIQWMRDKGWWHSTTEYDQCYFSSSCNLVDVEYDKYYTPTANESVVFEEGANRNVESARTGRTIAQTGRTTERAGRTTARTGRTTTQTSNAYTQVNTSAQTGKTTAQTGKATAQTGKATAQTGKTTEQAGRTTEQAGRTTERVGRTTAQTSRAYSNSAATSSSSGTYSGLSGASFTPGDYVDPRLLIFSGPPNIIITYNHGKVIPVDFERLRIKAISTLSNQLIPDSPSKLWSIFTTDYQLMPKGNYPLKFYYNYRGCLGVDADTPMISKPFIY